MCNVNRYLGIPYLPKGRTLEACDCWGLCLLFGKNELGIEYPEFMYDFDSYIDEAVGLIKSETALGGRWKSVDEFIPGDILIFRVRGQLVHCGVYIGNGDFLHTLKGRLSCVENLCEWKLRFTGAYRFEH
jgi:cell wall-associated NlpC family hydrolase